jgi:D-sedoheptulose 7-phosphate isomerase
MQPSADELHDRVRAHLFESADLKRQVVERRMDSILAAAELIEETFRLAGKVLLCGNGGSAADCQHMAAEFVSRLTKDFDRPGLPAIALTTDTSFLTAYANDINFEGVFAHQANLKIIALTGSGGRLANMADVGIAVPSSNTQYIQEAHLAIEHILCDLVERTLFEPRGESTSL